MISSWINYIGEKEKGKKSEKIAEEESIKLENLQNMKTVKDVILSFYARVFGWMLSLTDQGNSGRK